MSESEAPDHNDHWRRLAAELGLDVGPEAEQSPIQDRNKSEEEGSARQPVDEPRPPIERGRRKRTSPQEERVDERATARLAASDSAEEVEVSADRIDNRLFIDFDEAETKSDESEQTTGDAAPSATDPDLTDATDQPEKRRRRRRSRRKKKGEDAAHAGEVGDPSAEGRDDESSDQSDSEGDLDQNDDLSKNWNVPSWDELIGSLYRPER